ncbi:MAG: ATP-binding protein [Halohasta sp.]
MTIQRPRSPARFERLFEQLEDAVVEFSLVDGEPIIVGANRAFSEVFGYEVEEAVGEPLNDLIVPSGHQEEAEAFDERTAAGESNAAVVRRQTVDGTRTFVYRGVPYAEGCGFAIYADVTGDLQRERQLDVLQRVLRHNLRNDLNVVLGMADLIADIADDERTRRAAETIAETATGLADLSDEAKTVDRVLSESPRLEPTALRPVVESVATEYRQRFEAATIGVEVPTDLRVAADKRLGDLLESLVENAIEHNEAAEPWVAIRATATDETVELAVVDDGPGIPRAERRIITDDDEITPLNHGSGLGLWLVKWIAEGYGGQLDIETAERVGTVVRITLDRVDG